MTIISSTRISLFFATASLILLVSTGGFGQGLGPFDRDNAQAMLKAAKDDIKKNYYDPNFRGIDVETRFKEAEQKIKNATTRDQLMIIVAQTMLEFNDSHTFFIPPSRAARFEYGWEMLVIGDKTFITAVKPKSDAEAKGVKPGDMVVSVDGFAPSRDNLWKMYYRYYTLMPTRSIKLSLQSPGEAEPRGVEVLAKVVPGKAAVNWSDIYFRILREHGDVRNDRYIESGSDLMIWEMNSFSVSEDHIDTMMAKAKKFKSLILDLRGNSGGYTKTLERLVGHFFDHDIKIADQKARKETKPLLAKTRNNPFKGQVVVLIDSDSASAAELFARVIQLEKRGTVIGDRSSGAVMTSINYDHETGVGQVLYFSNSVTISDLLMTDGNSLEKVGVTPDEVVLASGADLASSKDPVLSRAAEILGFRIEAEKAGQFFPKEWK